MRGPNKRMIRVNDELAREIANIIRMELKDPRVKSLTSVLRVETTQDLKYCKVFVSVLGTEDEKQSVMTGLKNAAGFIRHLLAENVNLRNTPELLFKLDDSVEYAIKMDKLIKQVSDNLDKTQKESNDYEQ